MARRHVTEPLSWERFRGEGDEEQRFRLYRLCDCSACEGSGKEYVIEVTGEGIATGKRCPDCRGEGKQRDEVVSTDTAEGVGVALVRCGWEGEWRDEDGDPCAFGLLDRDPDCHACAGDGCDECKGTGKKGSGEWYVLPWKPSARNVHDAAVTLAKSKKGARSS